MNEFESKQGRPDARRFAALIIITAATSFALGHTLRQPAQMAANDISRWCTVWSLLERGSYVIDECPWQVDTQDKVFRAPKDANGSSPGQPPVRHYYSSKPALLPTLIAGVLYPARVMTGVPLEKVVLEPRAPRWTQKPDPDSPYGVKGVLETPKDPVRWPAYIFYFKPILVLLNVIPYGIFLVLFARVLDRYAANDWAWFFCLVAAAFGTYLLPFTQTLNNHTVAAFSAFFALYQVFWIWDDDNPSGLRFAAAGFLAAFAVANELPALAFFALLLGLLLVSFPRHTLLFFLPGALVPIVAFMAAQYAVFGEFKLAYEAFGTDEYLYEGSFWKTPLDLDALNEHPEPYATYFFHMTLGHHGIFSLTPIFVFSIVGAVRLVGSGGWFPLPRRGSRGTPMTAVAWLTIVLTVILLAFYTWNPKARNYGGSTQGLRWLMWLIPFWLLLLPKGVELGQSRSWFRGLALFALGISVMSVGYAIRNPWSHPWILDALEHLNLYTLLR
jgi:hypothetical protein